MLQSVLYLHTFRLQNQEEGNFHLNFNEAPLADALNSERLTQ